MKYANLHLHSNFSDGGFTPKQLIRIGKSLGYRALALTDHTGAMSCCGGNLAIPALEGITDEEFMMIKERRLG